MKRENTRDKPVANTPDEHAFTLIELLVVVVIMGLLLSLLLPSLNRKPESTEQEPCSVCLYFLQKLAREKLASATHGTIVSASNHQPAPGPKRGPSAAQPPTPQAAQGHKPDESESNAWVIYPPSVFEDGRDAEMFEKHSVAEPGQSPKWQGGEVARSETSLAARVAQLEARLAELEMRLHETLTSRI